MNNPFLDRLYQSAALGPAEFFAGEQITATATAPSSGSPTTIRLYVANGSSPVDSESFPGTVSYTFPANTETTVGWVAEASATWSVSCQLASDAGDECPLGLIPTISGTAAGDTLVGTPGNDIIFGLGGDDRISGGGGDDIICAGDGNDLVSGDAGNDELYGGEGSDTLSGGPGTDKLLGAGGDDRLSGDDGSGGDSLDGGAHVAGDQCAGDAGDALVRCNP